LHSKNLLTEEGHLAYKVACTRIRMSFYLAYPSNVNSHEREPVAINVHTFNIL